MPDYPGGIFTPREVQNRAGVVYDPDKHKVLFAEDITYIQDEIIAVEEDCHDIRKRIVEIVVVDLATALTTGDGKAIFVVPSEMDGFNLILAHAYVNTASSSGTPIIQIRNQTDSADMLSTRITIDANEKTSFTAAAQPVIDEAHDDIATGDEIAIDVDGVGTGSKGLQVILTFEMPA